MKLRPRLSLAFLPLVFAACAETPPAALPVPAGQATPPPPAASAPPAAPAKAAPRADAGLVHRSVLFSDPDRAQPKISPDGKHLAFLAPSEGVLNVWVGSADDPSGAKPVTQDKKRGVRWYEWAFTSDHVLYTQDKDGDENWHVFAVDLKSGTTKDLTPIDGVNAQIAALSPLVPGKVQIGLNDRDKRYHDLYDVDLKTGERKLAQKNDGFGGFFTDDHFKVRLAMKPLPDGSTEMLMPNGKDAWKTWSKIPMEDTLGTEPLDFDKAEKTIVMRDSRGRDTAALFAVDVATGKQTLLAEDARADVGEVLRHPTEKRVEAVRVNYDRGRWLVLDKALAPDFAALGAVADGDLLILSRSLDEKRWIVAYVLSDGPVRYYRYDRDTKKATFLFTNQKSLEGLALAKMHPVVVKSRDGKDLVSYLTLPKDADPKASGHPGHALPMVLLVHGGPWGRDEWGFNRMHQWLASRGYAVLSVNFRASTGFGKSFVNAGNKEWAAKMHDDLIDAVDWAVVQKIADPTKVAIMGGSYGGYATLVGLTFTPDKFACGVDIVGPSNLATLLATIPPYWAAELDQMARRIGDHRTDDGKKLLAERSPLTRVSSIQRPLLIGQGANDPRVKQAESDQIVKAMQDKKIPVTYVLFPDEGHGFARRANRMAFNAVAEAFLAQCIGGTYEPIGADFTGSSVTVPAGAADVVGLDAALPKR